MYQNSVTPQVLSEVNFLPSFSQFDSSDSELIAAATEIEEQLGILAPVSDRKSGVLTQLDNIERESRFVVSSNEEIKGIKQENTPQH